MTDMTPFESRLADRLDRELTTLIGAFDPTSVASWAIGRRTLRDRLSNLLARADGAASVPGRTSGRLRFGAAVLVILLAAAVATVVGALLLTPPSDRPLALLTASGELALAKPDGTDIVTLGASPLAGGTSQVRVAPDGRHLALIGGLFDFAMVDERGTVLLLDTERRWARQVAWAPDSRQFAMLSGRSTPDTNGLIDVRLVVSAPDGSQAWSVDLPGDASYAEDFKALAWSPDGATIVVTGYRLADTQGTGRLWMVDLASHAVRELPITDGSADVEPAFGPDGRLYVSRETQIDGGLWRLDLATGSSERLLRTASSGCDSGCATGYVRGIAVAPDGHRVAFVDAADHVSVIDTLTGDVQRIPQPQPYAVARLAWSRSGAEVLFLNSGRTGQNAFALLSVGVANGQTTVLSPEIWSFDLAAG